MTLEQYAYLGEIIAAIAVIASLIYVARQLAQNSALMRVNASSERLNRDFEISGMLAGNRELTEVWIKGDAALDSLDEADRTRLMFFERSAIAHWHNMFGLRRRRLLPDADWQELQWLIQNFGRRQAVRESWKIFRDGFEAPFQGFLEEQFSIGDRLTPQPKAAVVGG